MHYNSCHSHYQQVFIQNHLLHLDLSSFKITRGSLTVMIKWGGGIDFVQWACF